MKLSEIISRIHVKEVTNFTEMEIEGVTSDSREKLKNSVFVAVKGLSSDGAAFASDAVRNGARAVVYESHIDKMLSGVVYIKADDTRDIQSKIAAAVYSNPSGKLDITGVTGTNGKTSFAYIFRHILKSSGVKCGMLGTTEYDLGSRTFIPTRTTPDAVFLQRYLKEMTDSKLTHAVMEVSSHALALKRVNEVSFSTAVFTNLTRDHLDFHKSMEEYSDVKSTLFSSYMKEGGLSVINADDPYAAKMLKAAPYGILTYSSKDSSSGLFIRKAVHTDTGMIVEFDCEGSAEVIRTNLNGKFQAYNIAAAVLCAKAKGIGLNSIVKAFETDIYIPGRMETVHRGSFTVIIDYAHTPDALENTIRSVNEFKTGRLITVFGCGGNRDSDKRGLMAQAATGMSDDVIITSDNPRYEDPDAIIDDIIRSAVKQNYRIEQDRKKAIAEALASAGPGDVVLIAGKGHEDYQEIGGVKYPFSDSQAVKSILEDMK